jgi:hypothetical protein
MMGVRRSKGSGLLGSFSGPTSKKAKTSAAVGFVWLFARRSIYTLPPHRRASATMPRFRNFFQTASVAVQVDEVTATHVPACEAA